MLNTKENLKENNETGNHKLIMELSIIFRNMNRSLRKKTLFTKVAIQIVPFKLTTFLSVSKRTYISTKEIKNGSLRYKL